MSLKKLERKYDKWVYRKSLFLHVIPVGAIIRFFVSVWWSCDGTIWLLKVKNQVTIKAKIIGRCVKVTYYHYTFVFATYVPMNEVLFFYFNLPQNFTIFSHQFCARWVGSLNKDHSISFSFPSFCPSLLKYYIDSDPSHMLFSPLCFYIHLLMTKLK